MTNSHPIHAFWLSVPVWLALILSCGCRTVIVVATRDEAVSRRPRDSGDHIAVFRAELPEQPHKAIGSVRAKVKLSPYRKNICPDERILKKMKAKARELGADALVDLRVEQTKDVGINFSPINYWNSQIWIAIAIVWVSEPMQTVQ